MSDDATPAGDPDLIDYVHDVLDALRRRGAEGFTAEVLKRRHPALAALPPGRIDRMLLDMWRGGEEIYPDGLDRPDTHPWSFGRRPFPDFRSAGGSGLSEHAVKPDAHDDPAHMRRKAMEARALSMIVADPAERAFLIRMAEAYEWLAERIEARQSRSTSLGPY
jgi:hypothetical protein